MKAIISFIIVIIVIPYLINLASEGTVRGIDAQATQAAQSGVTQSGPVQQPSVQTSPPQPTVAATQPAQPIGGDVSTTDPITVLSAISIVNPQNECGDYACDVTFTIRNDNDKDVTVLTLVGDNVGTGWYCGDRGFGLETVQAGKEAFQKCFGDKGHTGHANTICLEVYDGHIPGAGGFGQKCINF